MPRTTCPNGRNATEALREIDEIHGTAFAPLLDDLIEGELRATFTEAEDDPRGGEAIIAALAKIFEHGLTLEDAARLLGRAPVQLAGHLVHDPRRARQVLTVEKLLRQGELSHGQIAAKVGMTRQMVYRLSLRFGVISETTERLLEGGGFVHSAETFELMRSLREGGHSYGEIATILGMSRNTVKSHCSRKGWKPSPDLVSA